VQQENRARHGIIFFYNNKEELFMLQVVTDSSCDLPEELIKKHHIRVVPLTVNIDDNNYLEGVDITPEEFYKKMAQSVKLPKTSQPPPAVFAQTFRELSRWGQVLCLTISSKLSGTYQSACLGRELSGVDVTVFDTLAGSLGHGLQVLKACNLAKAGCLIDEIMTELDRYRKEMKILILLNTLENIVKGGRLSKFQGNLAKILNIKLLLHNVDGEVVLLEKVRGQKKFLNRVIETIQGFCPDLTGRDIGITHFKNPEDVEIIRQILKEKCNPRDFLINSMGPTMATYAGEGGIIISF
jgi:DegV family protein with EDD domain